MDPLSVVERRNQLQKLAGTDQLFPADFAFGAKRTVEGVAFGRSSASSLKHLGVPTFFSDTAASCGVSAHSLHVEVQQQTNGRGRQQCLMQHFNSSVGGTLAARHQQEKSVNYSVLRHAHQKLSGIDAPRGRAQSQGNCERQFADRVKYHCAL